MDMRVALVNWQRVERDTFGRLSCLSAWRGERARIFQPYIFLVPVDGSPPSLSAVHVAAQMADRVPNAELHVLNVQLCSGNSEEHAAFERDGLHETEAARHALEQMRASYALTVVAGSPAEAIHAYVRDFGVAEIVMGSYGAGRIERLLMGSVAMDVAERACVPVTLVKASEQAGRFPADWVDWLVPCDGSAYSLRAVRYLAKYLPYRQDKPLVHLLNVQNSTGAAADRQQAERLCRKSLQVLDAAHVPYDFHVLTGDPVAGIVGAVERLGCGHVVMGTRGLGLLGKLVLGSVSHGVAHRTGVPVTLIA